MATCSECGAEIADGSQFCNRCGAVQVEVPVVAPVVEPAAQESDVSAEAPLARSSGSSGGGGRRALIIALVVFVVLLATGVGVNAKVRSDRAEAARVAEEKHAAELESAKSAALVALTAVEKCESAVEVGVTLDDLSDMSTNAREEVLAFTRSDDSKLLPDFTKAIKVASDAYVDSASEWFADNETAMSKYNDAVDSWIESGSGDSPELEDFKDDSAYQQSWSSAGTAVAAARATLAAETSTE
ncbi:MAG: zinc ribbon domain-containing protein [Coriobacteriia bacterium]|nr:zinc ribbon domain-containing protein [Coriobacteriia bacterium]